MWWYYDYKYKAFFSNQFQKKQIIANIVLCEPLLF